MSENYCHCCGLPIGDFLPWGEDGKTPLWDICECCGTEYGYEDSSESALIRYRKNWLSSGAKWFSPKLKPKDWELEEQLKNLPVVLPVGIRSDIPHAES